MVYILFLLCVLVNFRWWGWNVVDNLYFLTLLAGSCQMRFSEALAVFRECYFDNRSLVFDAWQINLSFMQADELPYKHQSDTTSCYFGINSIAATEMKFEQFLLFVGRDADSCVSDFHAPWVRCFWNENLYISIFRSIFQCVRNDVLKDRFHLFFIKPYVHIPEITFISEVDMFDVGVLLERIEYFIHKRV